MERFEVPTDRADLVSRAAAFGQPMARSDDAFAPVPADPPATATTEGSTWDGDAIVVPTSGYGGLLALGAVAGTTAAAVFGAVVGWTGPVITFAALVGLDVGVLVGAGVGGIAARREQRSQGARRPSARRRSAGPSGVVADPSR